MRLAPSKTLNAALLIVLGLAVRQSMAIPLHAHGDSWTSFERDGDRGGPGAFVHSHPSPGGHEAGDESHQHFDTVPIPGPGEGLQPWGAFGAWDNRRAFVDGDVPFTDKAEYTAQRVAHGFIEEVPGKMPRYAFDDDVPAAVRDRVKDAFDLWGGIQAQVSPTTGKPLVTGIGFELEADNTKPHELRVHWDDIVDTANGGFVTTLVEGNHTSANPVNIFFDNSFMWDLTVAGGDLTKPHFFSVALHEIGHTLFLEHSPTRDTDLMQPVVGEALDALIGSTSYRWLAYVEAANEMDDRFTGFRYERVAITPLNPTGIATTVIDDRDSVRAIKALYSIPFIPEPSTALLGLVGLLLLSSRPRARNRPCQGMPGGSIPDSN